MARESQSVWVSLDVVRANQSVGYRGRMRRADLDAIVAGKYAAAFVRLEDVHWIEQDQGGARVNAFGRGGQWEWHAGPIYLRPDAIATVAPLTDEYTEAFQRGLHAPE